MSKQDVAGNSEVPEAQEVSESEIAVHWKEEATIYPSPEFVGQANLTDPGGRTFGAPRRRSGTAPSTWSIDGDARGGPRAVVPPSPDISSAPLFYDALV